LEVVVGEGLRGVEVAYVGIDGRVESVPLAGVVVDFARVGPVRGFPSYRRQRSFPGLYYAACMNRHVGFESWLERDEAMSMDFDPQIAAFAAQPFKLSWSEGAVRARSHVPDFFARRADGTGIVVDCRPPGRIEPRDKELFEATARFGAELGWEFRLVGGHDPVWLANVRWLAGYRHPRYLIGPVAADLVAVFAEPTGLVEGAACVGDLVAVLPVLYHLLWMRVLRADLALRLEGSSVVVTT